VWPNGGERTGAGKGGGKCEKRGDLSQAPRFFLPERATFLPE